MAIPTAHADTTLSSSAGSGSESQQKAASPSRPTTSPRTTKFALPPSTKRDSTVDAPSPSSSGAALKPSGSILNRLTRRLSQGKTAQLVRRVSLGSRSSATTPTHQSVPMTASVSASATVSPSGAEKDEPKGKGVGLQRGARTLARSKSEGTATPKRARAIELNGADALDIVYGRTARQSQKEEEKATRDREHEGQGRLYWEERLGICWDGREQVHPDFTDAYVQYSSNSDVLAPAPLHSPPRVVYASTLSTFPPRPPLRSRVESHPPPTATLSPASQIIAEYRSRQAAAAETVDSNPSEDALFEEDDATTTATITPTRTPITARTRTGSLQSMSHPPPPPLPPTSPTIKREESPSGNSAREGNAQPGYDSDVSSASSVPRFARGSEDSSTSLESMRDDEEPKRSTPPSTSKPLTPVIRFALVDDGPVPSVESSQVEVEEPPVTKEVTATTTSPRARRASFITNPGVLDSTGNEGHGENWRECE